MLSISSIKLLKRFGLLVATMLGVACVNSYYGYSEAQWRSLNENQREAAIREYDYILQQKRELEYKEEVIDPVKEDVIERGVGKTPR